MKKADIYTMYLSGLITENQYIDLIENNPSSDLYNSFSQALDKFWNGGVKTGQPLDHVTFTDETIRKLGFDFSELLQNGVIEKAGSGLYALASR